MQEGIGADLHREIVKPKEGGSENYVPFKLAPSRNLIWALGTLNIPEHTWEILSRETFLVTLISPSDHMK